MSEWEQIGLIGVDSGTVWVGDPAYFFDERGGQSPEMKLRFPGGYDELVASNPKVITQPVEFTSGQPGLGVWVAEFGDDGRYPVEVRRDERAVAEVRVRFRP